MSSHQCIPKPDAAAASTLEEAEIPAAVTMPRLREIAAGVASSLKLAEEAAAKFTRDEDAEDVDRIVTELRSVSDLLAGVGL